MLKPITSYKNEPPLIVDPEFESQIPPLTEEEFEQLEENILADGVVIHPLVVWDGIIVDGHNRWRIIQKHPSLKYTVHKTSFPNRYAAIVWICQNQLGRRNLTPAQKKYLIGKQYEAEKASHGAAHFQGNQYSKVVSGQNDHSPLLNTRKRIAKETKTNDTYVRRAEYYAKGVDLADEIDPGIRQDILSGTLRPTAETIHAVAKASPEERPALVEQIRNPPEKEKKQLSGWSSMLVEMTDALDSLIFRWEFCQSNNPAFFKDEECREQIRNLIRKGSDFINNYEGEIFQQ